MADGYINGSSSSGGSVTIAANTGYAISNVSFTYTENKSDRVGGSPTVSPDTHYQYSVSSTTGTISLKDAGTAQQSVTLTTTNKARISAMTVTYNAVVTDSYDIHIGKNNADYTDESLTNTSGTTWSKTVSLDAGSYYEFKVKKTPSAGEAVWYGNNGSILATTSPAWDFSTSDGNCKLYTTVSGSYTFSWDTSTSKLTVTYPSGSHPTKRVYMACGSTTWCDASPKFYVHSWGVAEYNTEVQLNSCGDYYADIIWYNDYFQFTRNSSSATAYNNNQWNVSQDLTYSSSQTLWTCTGWSDSKGTFSSSAYSATRYSVTITPTNVTKLTGTTGANAATCGTEYTATFRRNAGYNLPATVTVTIGGSSATSGTDYTWTQATGTLTIPGTKITGNIEVSLSGTAVTCPDGSSEETLFSLSSVGSGYSNSSDAETELTDITVSGGFAYGYGTSSRALEYSNNKIKYNGGVNYIKLVLDCELQPGDVISFSCDANTGLNFNSTGTSAGGTTDYATGALNGSTYTVVADDGLDGENTIYCWRRTGNGTNVTAITITRPESCDAGVPGDIIKGSASGGTGTINLTASGSPASGDTWYWQTSSSGTAKTNSTASAYAVSASGTYYLRSYNSSDDCWNTTYKSVTVAAADLLTAISPTLSYDDEVEVGGTINPTLTGNSGSGTVTYSLNSVSPAGSLTINASTGAVTGVTAGGTATVTATITANGNYAGGSATSGTITVPDGTCLKITDAGKNNSGSPKWSDKSNGDAIENTDIDGTITGGTVTYSGSGSLTGNDTHGIIFDNDNDELTITLSGSNALVAGSVITIVQHGNSGTNKDTGFKISGNSMSPATCNNGSTTYKEMTQTYTVVAADGVAGTNSFTIKWTGTNQVYLKSMTVTGCEECTPITPSLSYSKTTIWMDDAVKTATPILDKDESTGSVTYALTSVTPLGCVTLNTSTGVVTAVKSGTATITASIAADGTHCANTASCNITVKEASCGYNEIASAVLTSKTAATLNNATLLANGLGDISIGSCKLNGKGAYFGLQLASGSFQVGDSIEFKIKGGDDAEAYFFATTDTTGLTTSDAIYCKSSISKGTDYVVRFIVTSGSMLTKLNATKKITIVRRTKSGVLQQNHSVYYVKVKRYTCPEGLMEFDATANSNWSTAGNWVGATGRGAGLPTINDRVHVMKPVTVDVTTAKAERVYLFQNSTNTGSLVLDAGKELVVAGTVRKTTDGSSYTATGENDINFGSTSALGLGALAIGNHATANGLNSATVNFSTLSNGSTETESAAKASDAQYVGTPFSNEPAMLYQFYNSWMYKFTNTGTPGWVRVNGGDGLEAFKGYCVYSADGTGHNYWMQGTLVASEDQNINLQYNGGTASDAKNENMLANSWMAPIKIAAFNEYEAFTNADATVYIYNTGSPDDYTTNGASTGSLSGQYATYTPGTAGTAIIPSMQAFSVYTSGSNPKISLDYSKLVYDPAAAGSVAPGANKAPRRVGVSEDEADKMRLFVSTEDGYGDMLYMWEREDFAESFENGWDGRKMFGESFAPQLYALTPDGNMAINCIPTFEGTVLGFKKGTENNTYTFTFEYEGDNTWYLNDLKEQTSTLIDSESTYIFMAADEDMAARFVISQTPIHNTPTGIEQSAISDQQSAVKKIVIDDHVFIIRNGCMYDATGVTVR